MAKLEFTKNAIKAESPWKKRFVNSQHQVSFRVMTGLYPCACIMLVLDADVKAALDWQAERSAACA